MIELRHGRKIVCGEVAELAEGGTLLRCCMEQSVPWVRIPSSPNLKEFQKN